MQSRRRTKKLDSIFSVESEIEKYRDRKGYRSTIASARAMALTSRPPRAGFPLTLPVQSRKLPKESWIKMSQVRTISVERLGRRICRLEESEVSQAVDGLLELIS